MAQKLKNRRRRYFPSPATTSPGPSPLATNPFWPHAPPLAVKAQKEASFSRATSGYSFCWSTFLFWPTLTPMTSRQVSTTLLRAVGHRAPLRSNQIGPVLLVGLYRSRKPRNLKLKSLRQAPQSLFALRIASTALGTSITSRLHCWLDS